MAESFSERLKRTRCSKKNELGRCLSQEDAARLFAVSLSCWRSWEHEPPRHLPDNRSRIKIQELWPEVFSRQP